MTPAQLEQIKEIFYAAVEQSPERPSEFLAEAENPSTRTRSCRWPSKFLTLWMRRMPLASSIGTSNPPTFSWPSGGSTLIPSNVSTVGLAYPFARCPRFSRWTTYQRSGGNMRNWTKATSKAGKYTPEEFAKQQHK